MSSNLLFPENVSNGFAFTEILISWLESGSTRRNRLVGFLAGIDSHQTDFNQFRNPSFVLEALSSGVYAPRCYESVYLDGDEKQRKHWCPKIRPRKLFSTLPGDFWSISVERPGIEWFSNLVERTSITREQRKQRC